MRRFERWTFHFGSKQLGELKELSKKSGVPQAVFVREALDYILKKYRYLLTMKKFNPEEARYLITRRRGVDLEEKSLLRLLFSPQKKRIGGGRKKEEKLLLELKE